MRTLLHKITRYRGELQAKLPDREIYMRTEGRIRYLKISSQVQVNILLAAASLATFTLITLATTTIISISLASERDKLSEHADALRDSQDRIDRYRDSVADFAVELTRRQQKLENIVQKRFGKIETEQQDSVPTSMRGNLPPEADALIRAEQRQLAFIQALTESVDERTASAEQTLQKVGMKVPREKKLVAMGGPFIPMGNNAQSLDALKNSFTHFDRVNRLLRALPSKLPASPAAMTSNFGIRIDPFTRTRAMHAGLDIRGYHGQNIYATADGRVVSVGRQGGYGKLIVIQHGQGLETRYGHLSGFDVKPGSYIRAGQKIARMGSTGRSTGTHLHFEVRINGRAVNPLPYLKNAPRIDQAKKQLSRSTPLLPASK